MARPWPRPDPHAGCPFGHGAAALSALARARRAELLLRRPWLPGASDLDQLGKIFQALGTPGPGAWPGADALPHFVAFQPTPAPPLRASFRQARGAGRPAAETAARAASRCRCRAAFSRSAAGPRVRAGPPRAAGPPRVALSPKPCSRTSTRLADAGPAQASEDALDLLARLIAFDPARRPSAGDALAHRFFRAAPAPTPPGRLPRPPVRARNPLALPTKARPGRCPARRGSLLQGAARLPPTPPAAPGGAARLRGQRARGAGRLGAAGGAAGAGAAGAAGLAGL